MRLRNLYGCSGLLLAALVVAGGCEDPKLRQLRADNAALQEQLDQALADADAAEARALNLDQDSADLQDQLAALQAQAQKVREGAPGEFVSVGPGVDRAVLPGSILFDLGKTDLKPASKSAMDGMVGRLRTDFGDREIFVIGHTDNTPIVKAATKAKHPTNWHLSTHRAIAVAQYLVSHGISPKRVVCAGCGEHRPKASNVGKSGKAQNRRVEVYAVSRSATP